MSLECSPCRGSSSLRRWYSRLSRPISRASASGAGDHQDTDLQALSADRRRLASHRWQSRAYVLLVLAFLCSVTPVARTTGQRWCEVARSFSSESSSSSRTVLLAPSSLCVDGAPRRRARSRPGSAAARSGPVSGTLRLGVAAISVGVLVAVIVMAGGGVPLRQRPRLRGSEPFLKSALASTSQPPARPAIVAGATQGQLVLVTNHPCSETATPAQLARAPSRSQGSWRRKRHPPSRRQRRRIDVATATSGGVAVAAWNGAGLTARRRSCWGRSASRRPRSPERGHLELTTGLSGVSGLGPRLRIG